MAVYDISGNEIATGGGSGGSPISGKRIMIISDSNVQYMASAFANYMAENYGCTMDLNATAGAPWETSNGADTTEGTSGVAKTNIILRDGVSAGATRLESNVDYYVYMLGTNMYTLGTPSDPASNVSTMCGAMRYCLQKMCWFGRNKIIGGILPFRNEDSGTAEPQKNQYMRQIYQEFSIPVLDLWDYGRVINNNLIPDSNGAYAYTDGGVHMNQYAQAIYMDRVGKWLAYEL